jgi:hypothetical protein
VLPPEAAAAMTEATAAAVPVLARRWIAMDSGTITCRHGHHGVCSPLQGHHALSRRHAQPQRLPCRLVQLTHLLSIPT